MSSSDLEGESGELLSTNDKSDYNDIPLAFLDKNKNNFEKSEDDQVITDGANEEEMFHKPAVVVENVSCEAIQPTGLNEESTEDNGSGRHQRSVEEKQIIQDRPFRSDGCSGTGLGRSQLSVEEQLIIQVSHTPAVECSGFGVGRTQSLVEEQLITKEKDTTENVDSAVQALKMRNQNIAVAIYHDRVDVLKDIIKERCAKTKLPGTKEANDLLVKVYSDACNRIVDAVEYNSLMCLEHLLNVYERNCDLPEFEVALRHRRLTLNWPLHDRPMECALHVLASRRPYTKMIELFGKSTKFLKKYVDMPDSSESTPLLVAVKRNNGNVAKWLLEHGAKVDSINKDGDSPIKCAALTGQADVLREMLTKCTSEVEKYDLLMDKNLYGNDHTIFYAASQSKDFDTLQLLLNETRERTWTDDREFPLLKREMEVADAGNFVCNICSSRHYRLLSILLEKHKDLPQKRDNTGATPLMRAAEAEEFLSIQNILSTRSGQESMGMIDNNGRNVFHYAHKNANVLEELLEQQFTLYDDKKIINQRDNEGITPMKLAADVKSTECFTMFLRCLEPGEEAALFSYPYVGYTSLDILQIILKEWKIYDKVVYENFLNGTGSFQPALLGAAAKGDIEIMEFLIENSVKDKPRFDDNTALHYAAACDKMEALKLLLNSFPEMIDYTNDCGQTPAGCAVEMGNVEILRYLLDKGARLVGCNAGENLLDCAFGNFKNEGVEEAVVEIINFCNKENSETTLQELMSNSHFGPDRLMARLVKDIPNVALLILDRCIDKQTDLQNRQSGVLRRGRKEIFNFYPLKNKGKESNGNLEAINSMIKYGRDECLAHRVVQMFLLKKLASPTLKTFLRLNLLLYMIFLISLTTYVGLQTSGSYSLQSPGLIALSTICLIFCVLSIIKELLQAIFSRREYFSALNNYLEWVIYISAIIYLAKTDGNNKDHGQITAGAIAVFLAWINFIWFLKRFPRYGIYIIMTQKVFVSVIKVLPMVLLFIVAFGMAFLMLMPGDEGFKNIPNSFLTTSVMMTGEIDFRDIFLGNDNDPLRPWQRLFLVVFLVLVTIVMMNLLVGLAVDDIGGIMQRSEQSERLYQAKLVVTLEQLFYRIPKLSPPAVEDRMEYPPDREQVKGSKKLRKFVKLLKGTLKSSNNTGDNDDDDKLTCLEKKLERLTDVQEKMEEQVNQIQKTLETMANRM